MYGGGRERVGTESPCNKAEMDFDGCCCYMFGVTWNGNPSCNFGLVILKRRKGGRIRPLFPINMFTVIWGRIFFRFGLVNIAREVDIPIASSKHIQERI